MSPERIGILGLAGIGVTSGLFMMKRIDRVEDRVTQLEVALTERMARLEGLFEGYMRLTKPQRRPVTGCYTVRTCQCREVSWAVQRRS